MDVSIIEGLLANAEGIARTRFNDSSDAVQESILAVLAYEETLRVKHGRQQRAAYTWRMMEEHGVIGAVERIVTRPEVTQGYMALVDLGLEDFSFEAVVARHPEAFSKEAVKNSKARIAELEAKLSGKPSYWWVNHKQTHADEIQEGYIWSPMTNRNRSYICSTRFRNSPCPSSIPRPAQRRWRKYPAR